MKKNVYGKKLKRDKNERKALFKSLMSSLILHERIQTTEEKAKAIKPEIEKLVTKAKKATNSSMDAIRSSINPVAFEKFIKNVAPRFASRNGGYTRIIRLNQRLGDQAQMVLLEWVEGEMKNENLKIKNVKTEINKKSPSKKLINKKSNRKSTPKKFTKTKTTRKVKK